MKDKSKRPEIKNETDETTEYILSKILIEKLLKENLITRKEFDEIDEKNKKSFN